MGFDLDEGHVVEHHLVLFHRPFVKHIAGDVLHGQVDAFWEQELNLYDVAAGALIAKEAGATVTDFKGNEGIFPKQILVTNGKLLDQLLPLM